MEHAGMRRFGIAVVCLGYRAALLVTLLAVSPVAAPGPAAANDPTLLRAQQRLISKSYNPGRPDGLLGDATRRALREFQQDKGLPRTGRPDRRTLEELGVEAPPPAPP